MRRVNVSESHCNSTLYSFRCDFLDKTPSPVHTHTYLNTIADYIILAEFPCTEKHTGVSAHKVNFHPVRTLLTQT